MARATRFHSELLLSRRGRNARPQTPVNLAENANLQAIWDVVCMIPRGQVSTYGAVARAAGLPGRARLTGYALKVSPPGMHVPWHRVVGAGGRIVFPKLSVHHKEQARRLRAEKISLKAGRVDAAHITTFEGSYSIAPD
jgi:methylated-DNA-protein-cysteine methyltransferase-like protein